MPQTYLPGDARQRIQDLIKNRKITQAELAEKIGLSESTLSRFLQGKTKNLGDPLPRNRRFLWILPYVPPPIP